MFTARMRVRARACTNVRIEFGEEGGGRRMMIHVNDRLGSKTSLLVSPDTSIKVSVRIDFLNAPSVFSDRVKATETGACEWDHPFTVASSLCSSPFKLLVFPFFLLPSSFLRTSYGFVYVSSSLVSQLAVRF